jgi:site-specific DNA-methyltransferase (adenine-specific)
LWDQYERIIKDNGAIVLTATEPFSSYLRLSNIKLYKYDWKWIKSKVGNFLNCKNSPMKKYEDIVVFSKGNVANRSKILMQYHPQGLVEINKQCNNFKKSRNGTTIEERPSRQKDYVQKYTGYPNNILEFKSEDGLHPTQKPIGLLEYLIKTYTSEGEIVLDNCAGSFSTGIACINTGRKFIGYELEEKYFEVGKKRLEEKVRHLQ